MDRRDEVARLGLDALRCAVLELAGMPRLSPSPAAGLAGVLMSEALGQRPATEPPPRRDDLPEYPDDPEASRIVALVDLARDGDTEAFGELYDHYNGTVYRFLYYRVGSHPLAEDLASETFFRALRSMAGFKWQGRDFGAWLVTIARNLIADHYKAGRTRLETATDDLSEHDTTTAGPEDDVMAALTNEALLRCVRTLAAEQQECLVLRFLQGMSIAETAEILRRSEGAVKQLQLRAVRNLARLLPEGMH
ncbi:MAG: sigma-70 family RNA polymerase sigma factor [Nocardioidaceae bacterium]